MGGIGEERQISIQSGECVAKALETAGVNVVRADITPQNMDVLGDGSVDVFFLALHGKFGEDGELQEILENKPLVYTGSEPRACRVAFDKMASKKVFDETGIHTPPAIEFDASTNLQQLERGLQELADKYVVKPIRQGSSVGVSIANDSGEAIGAAQECLSEFGDCMIEQFIPGRELSVGILCGRSLPIIEIRTKTGFYDYHAKYSDEQTKFLFDTITDQVLSEKIKKAALDCFGVLGCRDFARVDFILGQDQIPYVLEINTIPGLTTHSLVPKAAAKAGLSMSDLCVKIIEAALQSRTKNKPLVSQVNQD